jgi:hypothetical protein
MVKAKRGVGSNYLPGGSLATTVSPSNHKISPV